MLAWLLVGCGGDDARDAQRSPNVLFILSDEHRWDALGCYGNDVVRTPNLDQLAAEGVRLDAFYVASPLCSPSRASFLSGLYPHQSGVMDNRERAEFAENVPTIADAFHLAGYRTAFVGKAHMGGDPTRWGFRDLPVLLAQGGARLDRPSTLSFDGVEKKVEGPVTRIFADEAIRYLEGVGDDPWFLWMSTRAAHKPYFGDPEHQYDAEAIVAPPGWPPGQELSDHDWTGYYASVSFLDAQVGRVLDALDRLGLSETTLVFFAGDNGSMFGSHGEARKQVWFEECVRTPAIVRWPGRVEAGSNLDAPMSSVDFLPSVIDLLDGEQPSARPLEGASMLPALTGEQPLRRTAFAEIERREVFGGGYWRMVRDERYKLIRFIDRDQQHLYDLEADPHELVDLAAEPSMSDVKQRLMKRLDQWESETR